MIRVEDGFLCPRCFKRFAEDTEVCSDCGHDSSYKPFPDALPEGSVLAGRFLLGCAAERDIAGFSYHALELREGHRCIINEFFPQGICGRDADGLSVLPEPGLEALYSETCDCFHDEAVLYGKKANIPAVVHTLGFFNGGGTAYCVSEYAEGVNLTEYMAQKGGKLDEREAAGIAAELCSAIEALAASGRSHGDIRPENILICADGRRLLKGFGESRQRLRTAAALRSGLDAPKRGDIEMLGLTFYCMTTGRDLYNSELTQKLPDVAGLSSRCAAIIGRMLGNGGGFRDIGELREALLLLGTVTQPRPRFIPRVPADPGLTVTMSGAPRAARASEPELVRPAEDPAVIRQKELELAEKRKRQRAGAITAAVLSIALLLVVAALALGSALKNHKPSAEEPTITPSPTQTAEPSPSPDVTVEPSMPVTNPKPTISLKESELTLTEGDEIELISEYTPEDAELKYSSSDEKVASVNKKGQVKAEKEGMAVITASITVDGETYKAECRITVMAKYTDIPIKLSQYTASVAASGGSVSFTISCGGTWTVETDSEWLALSKHSGESGDSVTIDCAANSGTAREGVITVRCLNRSTSFTVTQLANEVKISSVVDLSLTVYTDETSGNIELFADISNVSSSTIQSFSYAVYLYNDNGIEIGSSQGVSNSQIAPSGTVTIGWTGNSETAYAIDFVVTEISTANEVYTSSPAVASKIIS